MMKRPRSFISTLTVILSLLFAGWLCTPLEVEAGALPRVLDPRAGDPTEPDDSPHPDNSGLPADQSEYIPSVVRPYSSNYAAPSDVLWLKLLSNWWISLAAWTGRR
jgi:hypothetical protein